MSDTDNGVQHKSMWDEHVSKCMKTSFCLCLHFCHFVARNVGGR